MPVTIKSGLMKYKNPTTGAYVGINAVSDNRTADQIAAIDTAGAAQVSAMEQKGAEVIEEIPSSYTEIVEEVTEVKNALNQTSEDVEEAKNDISELNDEKAPIIKDDTENGYNHTDLINPELIAFVGNSYAFRNAQFSNKINLLPRQAAKTITNENSVVYSFYDSFTTLNGTASKNGGSNTYSNAVLSKPFAARTYTLLVQTDVGTSLFVNSNRHVECYVFATNSSGNTVATLKDVYINTNAQTTQIITFTTTEEYYGVLIRFTALKDNVYNNFKIWCGLYDETPIIVDTEIAVSSGTYIYESSGLSALTTLNTMQHISVIRTCVDTKYYIDKKIIEIIGYITPEMYGALGDGVEDDYSAIMQAISAGIRQGRAVMCSKKYKTSETIAILSNAYIVINELNYTGQDEAIKVQGKNNYLEVRSLTSSGEGLSLTSDSTSSIQENRIIIGKLTAGTDGIIIRPVNYSIYSNYIDFRDIAAGGNSYYCIKSDMTQVQSQGIFYAELVFRGGHLHNAHYAVKEVSGKFENLYIEDNIKGGFLNCSSAFITGDRHWECCHGSDEPFIKMTTSQSEPNATNCAFTYKSFINLPINKIDLSGVSKTYNNGSNTVSESNGIGIIDCPIGPYVSSDGIGSYYDNPISERAYMFADALILTPLRYNVRQITEDTDFRVISKNANRQYPNEFIIDTANVTINLHTSYCWIGYKSFTVCQRNGYYAKFYEAFGNRCVFDGENLGDGDYIVECYVETKPVYCDGRNMKWRYKKVTNSYTVVV